MSLDRHDLALNVIQANAGKRAEEIINALYRQGLAIVPLAAPPGTDGTRVLNLSKTPGEIWTAQVEHARVRA